MLYPYLTLDVPETATDEEVRRAYLQKIRIYSPEQSPDEFQRVCEAYELIKTELARTRLHLFGMRGNNPGAPMADLVPKPVTVERHRAGVTLWIETNTNQP
ncbi:MAG: J domain-containing protein [Lentisphaerae bacterium]|nr:J domain-containing protein [Lentisphaerota bacterium]